MICEGVLSIVKKIKVNIPSVISVERSRFNELHGPGQNLISAWAHRSTSSLECADHESFEPFIFGWIALNGWASCVTRQDNDTKYLEAIILDKQLTQEYERALNGSFEKAMSDFREMWPIFRTSDHLYVPDPGVSRSQVVEEHRRKGLTHRPGCAFVHLDSEQQIPLDWPHTISSIYQVRCNLFHGQKGLHCENDVAIVSRAHRALAHLLPLLISSRP